MFLTAAFEVGFCGWKVAHFWVYIFLFFLVQEFQQLAFSGHVAIMLSLHSAAGFWRMAW